jgi:hypothetical protein
MMIDRSGVGYRKKEGADSRLPAVHAGEAGKQSEKDILGYRFGVVNTARCEIAQHRGGRTTVQGFEGFTIRCPVRVQDDFTGGFLLTFRCT